ncbi:helix-turn-helix domain-containing protein [Streptomyces bauhiniae]
MESGKRNPSLAMLRRIAIVVGVSLAELFEPHKDVK